MTHAHTDMVEGYLDSKGNFAVFKHLAWLDRLVRLLVYQLISVTGFSVEQQNSTGCKIEYYENLHL